MSQRIGTAIVCLATIFLIADQSWGRGGRGGGGRGGGGGGRGRSVGGTRGSFQYSSPNVNRSPSMSRSSAPASRPSAPSQGRPAAANSGRGAVGANRPTAGTPGNRGVQAQGGGRTSLSNPRSYQRPTQSQLNNFLNIPGQTAGTRSTPSTLPAGPGSGGQSRTYETARGGTITVGGAGGTTTGPGGNTVGGAVGGIQIETAGGNTVTRGGGAVGATDGQNAAVAGGSRTAVQTAQGGTAVGGSTVRGVTDGTNSAVRRGSAGIAQDAAGNTVAGARAGYADSSGNRAGASVRGAQNQWGYTAVNATVAAGAGGTGRVATAGAVRGPRGNVVSGGRGAAFVNGQFVGGKTWTAVNGNFTRWGYFTPRYFGAYPRAWWPGKWAMRATAWTAATWAVAGEYCGCEGSGTYYDYGESVTYDDGTVYYEGEAVATSEQYYSEAEAIAQAGSSNSNDEWLPLGVFAVVAEANQSQTEKVVQLAINQAGEIRGNLQDMLTEEVTPLIGAVDQQTQRAVFKPESQSAVMVETGLYNLTNDEVPILVHFSPDQQESRMLVRLQPPEEKATEL